MGNEKYYKKNKKYSDFLNSQDVNGFQKYIDYLVRYSKNDEYVLDAGCGTGNVIVEVAKKVNRQLYGIEVSDESINICVKKKLRCSIYDGRKFPFKDKYFHVVGSFNVLEHTDYPEEFLNEQLRVLKPDGYLIIACPNFLSLTNNFHHHTRGFKQKIKNLSGIIERAVFPKRTFEKMKTIKREQFHVDDDACNVTNPQDILSWGKRNGLRVKSWSGQQFYSQGIKNNLDFGVLRVLLGSVMIVFQKN